MFHVLQHKSSRLMVFDEVRDLEKQVALRFVFKSVLLSQTQFLRHARDTEWLTRKTRAQDVVRRNLSDAYGMNVSMRALAKIFLVCFLRVLVPIARPHAFAPGTLKRYAKATDSAEKINEAKPIVPAVSLDVLRRLLAH